MKKLLVAFLLSCSLVYGVSAGKVWRVPTGGTHPGWGAVDLTNSNSISGAIPRANLPATGYQLSSSTGTFSTSSASYVDVTNATVTITATGRPIVITLVGDGANPGNNSKIQTSNSGSVSASECNFKLLRGATVLNEFQILKQGATATGFSVSIPPGAINSVDVPSAGSYTYKLQAKTNSSGSCNVFYSKLLAYEIMGN